MAETQDAAVHEAADARGHGADSETVAPERASVWGAAATILFGLVLLVLLVPLVMLVDYGAYMSLFEMGAPPAGAFGVLFGLLLANVVVFVFGRTRLFRRWQLVVVYVMLMTGLPVVNLGLVQPVLTNLTNVASEYVNRDVPSVAPAYAVQDPAYYPKVPLQGEMSAVEKAARVEPLKRFWSGVGLGLAEQFQLRDKTFAEKLQFAWGKIPWGVWRGPLLNWGAFIVLLFVAILFLVEILRQQWVERENLAFPLAVLPAALIDEARQGRVRHPLLGNWIFWLGAVVSVLLLALSGLRHYSIGDIARGELYLSFKVLFNKAPWDAIQNNVLVFSPLLIGVGYLMHLEITRSVWIFFFLGAVFQLLAANAGWNVVDTPPEPLDWQIPGYPFPRDQAIGAMAALSVFLLWRSREGLVGLLKAPFGGGGGAGGGEGAGLMPRRLAAWGFLACFVGLVLMMVRLCTAPEGAPGEPMGLPGVALIVGYLVLFFLMVVAFARLRAEAGVPNNFLVPSLIRVPRVWGGPSVWGWRTNNLVNNHFGWMALSSLPAMAPLQLEGLEVARRHGPRPRTLGIAVVAAFVVALVVGGIGFLWMAYTQGEGYTGKNISYGTMPLWVFYRTRGKALEIGYFHSAHAIAALVGLGIMVALLLARAKWLRFPLHPLGYLIWCVAPAHAALMQSNTVKYVHLLWGPFLVAWFVKRTVIRYGGMKLYHKLLPLFLGMIFGQLLMIVFWTGHHAYTLVCHGGGLLDPMLDLDQPVYVPEVY